MKRIFRLLAFFVMIIMPLHEAFSYDFCVIIQNGTLDSYNLFFNVIEGSMWDLPLCEVTYSECNQQGDEILYNNDNKDYKGIISVPNTVEYGGKVYKVHKIGDHAFQNCKELTGIYLSYLDIIGKEAFKDCSLLKYCNIADYSVYEIHASAFENCKSLERFTFIPAIDAIPSIEEKAFAGCTGLKIFSLFLGDILLSCPKNVFYVGENNVIDCSLGVDLRMIEEYKSISPWCWFKEFSPIEVYPIGGGSTSLLQIEDVARDNQTSILYTIDGKKVERNKKGSLKKGIYIHGNKKLLLK